MDWETVDTEITKLAAKVTNQPDIIVGVVRGGLIPARLLAKHLGVKDMYALTVKKQGSDRVVANTINADLSDKEVLLVEDVLETGTSMIAAKKYLESIGAKVQTASLYFQPRSEIIPDYYLSEQSEVPVFPWD